MKCLRCGYCCFNYDVIIMIDLKKKIEQGNVELKRRKERCRHITGNVVGQYSCLIHDSKYYGQTPCFDHGQIEESDSDCRMGKWILSDPSRHCLVDDEDQSNKEKT